LNYIPVFDGVAVNGAQDSHNVQVISGDGVYSFFLRIRLRKLCLGLVGVGGVPCCGMEKFVYKQFNFDAILLHTT